MRNSILRNALHTYKNNLRNEKRVGMTQYPPIYILVLVCVPEQQVCGTCVQACVVLQAYSNTILSYITQHKHPHALCTIFSYSRTLCGITCHAYQFLVF